MYWKIGLKILWDLKIMATGFQIGRILWDFLLQKTHSMRYGMYGLKARFCEEVIFIFILDLFILLTFSWVLLTFKMSSLILAWDWQL